MPAPRSNGWLESLQHAFPFVTLGETLARSQSASVSGVRGSLPALLAGAVALHTRRCVLLVVAHLDEADDALDDLECFGDENALKCMRFGALEVLPGESSVSMELLAERLGVVQTLATHKRWQGVLVAPIQALMQSVPRPDAVAEMTLTLGPGVTIAPGRLLDWLDRAGYRRADAVDQPGDFAVRGGIIDLVPVAGACLDHAQRLTPLTPVRLDFFGDQIETVHAIDPSTLATRDKLHSIRLVGATTAQLQSDERIMNLLELLPDDALILMHETLELTEQARGYYERLTNPRGIYPPNTLFKKIIARPHAELNAYSGGTPGLTAIQLPVEPLPAFDTDAKQAVAELGEAACAPHSDVVVLCGKPAESQRLGELLAEFAPRAQDRVMRHVATLHRGFVWRDTRTLTLVPHHELFHRYDTKRRIRRITASPANSSGGAFIDLDVGDYVVHIDHGIARFTGLRTMKRNNTSEEYLTLEFANDAKVHVPAAQIDLIQKYIGGFEGKPPLSTLGGAKWKRQKQQVAEAVKDLAKELLQVQAARVTQPGIRFPADTTWQHEFEAEFPYDETQDQLAAIDAIKRDMREERPMDRLICGDVGFGKTEVAIRAAFKAIEFGKQVAVLVPTTVLAEQHERTFRGRMADYPFRIESLSRFKTDGEARKTLDEVKAGRVDVLIGTHRILSNDVKFADLGLVIIDEEQRFGVEHKNKLLSFRLTADVLTLSATPIPRTLHMAMVGLRDISSLTTAPIDRRAIVTEVAPYDEKRIQQALIRELNRDGQTFFVHNRITGLHAIAHDLQRLVPGIRVLVGHGQMPPRELEQVMLAFMRHEADVLVSTTIIESGIDIPTANTMFINRADHFGLAELHQLRGRVGRYKHRAYCYLLLPPDQTITEVAIKRLQAIEQYAMLGAGFKIAMRDLEIRGAGNLLGSEQSGHIAAIGYELYCLLLEQETKRLRREPILDVSKTHLELPVTGSLPKAYIPSNKHRMDAYRRLVKVNSLDELDAVVADLTDAFGQPPPAAQTFIDLTQLRVACSTLRIDILKLEGPDLIFTTQSIGPLEQALKGAPGRVTVLEDGKVYYRPPANYLTESSTLLAVLRKLLVRPIKSALH